MLKVGPRLMPPVKAQAYTPTPEQGDISEMFRVAYDKWCDLEAAASLLEDMKSHRLASLMAETGEEAVARAEREVKSSGEWVKIVQETNQARLLANKAKGDWLYLKMKHEDAGRKDANRRAEMRLG